VTSEKPIVTPTPIQGETIMVTFTRFVPNTLTVKKGKEINFVNFSGQDIHIESDETKELKIGLMKDNDTSNPIKLSPGTYKYYDKLNPKITGEIVVTN
jgi:plastocyanin